MLADGSLHAVRFGTSPVVTDADVGGDGDAMPTPAPFLVDPLDTSQLLIGTCRVWRGPASGVGWSASNAISPILDSGATGVPCNGDALIRSMAAMPLAAGSEVIYLGMYGSANDGANLPGHVLSAIFNPSSSAAPTWTRSHAESRCQRRALAELLRLRHFQHDHRRPRCHRQYRVCDRGGHGANPGQEIQIVYRSTNGGANWTDITQPARRAGQQLAVDPQNANTVYVATDAGVYFTTEVGKLHASLSPIAGRRLALDCQRSRRRSQRRAGFASAQVLVAATYGRGIWQTPLWSAGTALTAASAEPASLAFPTRSSAPPAARLTVTLDNTGSLALTPSSISMSGRLQRNRQLRECPPVAVGASCTIQVTFTPQATGPLTGQMTIYANVYGGQTHRRSDRNRLAHRRR